MGLFPWLVTLYELWKNIDSDVIYETSLVGMGELMKNGCTTCFDHHYVFPKGQPDLIDTQFHAAEELRIRMLHEAGCSGTLFAFQCDSGSDERVRKACKKPGRASSYPSGRDERRGEIHDGILWNEIAGLHAEPWLGR